MSIYPTMAEPTTLPGGTPPPVPVRFHDGMTGIDMLGVIFQLCRDLRVSDVQMQAGRPVYIHTNKGIEKLDFLGRLSARNMEVIFKELIRSREEAARTPSQSASDLTNESRISKAMADFAETKVSDFSCDGIPIGSNGERSGRLRVQAHLSSVGLGITCRVLNDFIPELESLGIDPDTVATLRRAVLKRAGLCLVTGPTGSGKSTTLASLIDWLRRNHAKHIVTLEDPVEYRYPEDMVDPQFTDRRTLAPSIVTQQEVGRDIHSYRQGLKDVLRKAPHVILLGEIRDRETMETCMEAAQTGHLVLSTLHTTGAVKTLGRILEMYPRESHSSVLSRLSEILLFVHSQGLLPGGPRRVLNYEFLQNNDDAVSSAIANYGSGPRSLQDVIQRAGNTEWDTHLGRLLRQGLISSETYEGACLNRSEPDY